MSENDNKEEKKKDKLISKRDIAFIIATLFISIALIFLIAWLVRLHEGKEWIDLKTWLSYYGSICGAMFGGCITAIGLNITFRVNAKQLKEQREHDDEKFNQQMKIHIINEKIKDYKECIESIDKLINCNKKLYNAIDEYYINIMKFIIKLDRIKEYKDNMNELNLFENIEMIFKNSEPDPKVFSIDNMHDKFGEVMESLELVEMNSKCISQQNIINNIRSYVKSLENTYNYYKFISEFFYKNNFSIIPENYFKEEGKMYNNIKDKIEAFKNNVSVYKGAITEVELNFLSEKRYIRNGIGELYNKKYNLDKNNNEQKLSNNI